MDENWIFYIKVAVIIFLLYILIKGVLRQLKLRQFYKKLQSAPPISDLVKVGDYVNFSGTLTMPEMNTKKYGYWGVILRAVFETKAKKPNRGMTTHRPVIYKAESDAQPLMLKTKKHLVHIAIDKPLRFMVNMKTKQSKTKTIPINEAKEFDSPKYKSYEITKYWLPERAKLHIWARVTDINKNCISVSTASDANIPTLIYNGFQKDIFGKFSFRLVTLLLLILYSPIAIVALLTIDNFFVNEYYILITEVTMFSIGLLLYRLGRIDFVK